VGLSMEAMVDISDKSGKALADAPRTASNTQTQVYAALDDKASAEVQRVIAANAGAPIKSVQ
jgi:membrane fusion protein (multidrug efflux system)